MGLGVAAIVVIWLVFSVLKKVIGLLFLVGLAVAAFVLWQNPEMQRSLIDWVRGFIG